MQARNTRGVGRQPPLTLSWFRTIIRSGKVVMMMRNLLSGALAVALTCSLAQAQTAPPPPNPDTFYKLGPDSLEQEGVPRGEIRGPFTLPSSAYRGTQHTYWVFVPAQYTASEPASLMIFNDGQAFKNPAGNIRAHNVLDNLIFRREIPVMIAVFINPGRTPEQPEPTPQNWGDKDTNRPTEYNTLDDRYARVIVDELMPALHKDFNIAKDPERHGIGGASSGAIAAFTVAWERPDHFRKVLSIVGSFTNIRGGHVYPDIVLKADRKPIRVFLQDGRNDNRALAANGNYDQTRDWFYQNVRLMEALVKKGYDVNYSWGMNRHGQAMGGAILPEMMRWLWRDHPVSTDPRDMTERSMRSAGPPAPVSSSGGTRPTEPAKK
jgi:enterochelin esterase-like enzyme